MHAFLHIEKTKQKTSKKKGERERKEKTNKNIDQLNFLYTLCLQNDFILLLFVLFCIILYIAVLCAAMFVIGKH